MQNYILSNGATASICGDSIRYKQLGQVIYGTASAHGQYDMHLPCVGKLKFNSCVDSVLPGRVRCGTYEFVLYGSGVPVVSEERGTYRDGGWCAGMFSAADDCECLTCEMKRDKNYATIGSATIRNDMLPQWNAKQSEMCPDDHYSMLFGSQP